MPHEINRHWFGTLTADNLEAVAAVLREMLTGARYTFVSVNEWFGPVPRPDVRTSQRLTPENNIHGEAISVWKDDTTGQPRGIIVSDTYGVWSLCPAFPGSQEEKEGLPYLAFEWN